ncbi:UNVERIFIED_CONTAM: protein CELLULOSE SYNTHASE INTERACTIVE 3 [Sesamum radiatum]|uniref:Protein CELLULOSE SYNTHASE INTERACTIVE 3 n=1 Tax=Sesamum radiatum TaxID=300843 RepID=A0AAW2M6Q6_SESRA
MGLRRVRILSKGGFFLQMSKLSPAGSRDPKASSLSRKDKESNGTTEMDEKESMLSRVAQLIEQLHSNVSSPQERELTTARLLGIAKARKEARALIGSHGQAMPLFVSILRNGTPMAKINVAATLSVLCKDEDLRIKVLLGGCIPPLLSLLKSDATEARKVAAEALCVVSSGVLSDHVGMKIFVTEGVVPTLWEQLSRKNKQDKVVEGFVTGALRIFVEIKMGIGEQLLMLVEWISLLVFSPLHTKVIGAGAIKTLLGLLGQHKDASVRANAAEALEALSLKSTEAKQAIVDAQGMPVLIGAIVAPSKEGMQGEWGQALQQHSTQALANICSGMSALLLYLGELSRSPRLAAPVADIIGALAYALMVFKQSGDEEPFESTKIESILIILLKPRDNKLVQERLLEAMASLYGNPNLSVSISQSEAKKVLIGLITMATGDAQEYLILALIRLCTDRVSVWEALGKREGIQMLISSLGLSSEQHQEYAVEMLAILTEEVDDSKWAITAAGGIPPLVQLIEVGSHRAREGAACVLWKLGCHSEDIRACVESSGAIPALIWLLKIGVPNEQEASATALIKLTRTADSATINQLLALLFADSPSSKVHIIKVLGHVLSTASHSELVHKGATANTGLRSLVQVLNSSDEKTQEYAASVLADLFSNRQDICDSLATDEVINPCMKLLTSKTQGIVTQSARALSALSRPTKTKTPSKMSYIAEGDVQPLIKLAKTSSMDSAESAMSALANLLSDRQVAAEALAEDVVSAITRVLGEGSLEGKKSAACALYQLLKHFPVGDVLIGRAQCRFAVLAVVDSLNAIDMDYNDAADALDVVSLLARTKQGRNSPYLPWSALSEVPSSLEPLVRCLCEGPISVQDKAIEILSRLSRDQPVVLGNLLISNSRAIGALASRITKVSSLEVRVGGIALLICATKEHKIQSMGALEASGYMKPLIYALVDMIKQSSSLEFEITTPRGFTDRSAFRDGDDIHVPDPATVLGGTVALWLLAIVSSSHSKHKITVMEAGGLEALSDKLAEYAKKEAAEFGDTEGVWISTVLAAVLFQDANVVSAPMAIHFVPSLAILLKSDEMIDRFFAAQAMASLVCYGNKGINLAIANSGAVAGLTTLIGHLESNMLNLIALSEEFSLIRNPEQVVLESLFLIDDVRVGSVARKTIPVLVDLLRPMPDRPGAPLLLNPDLLQYEAAASCMDQLIAVLHLGSRSARLSAARALNELFDADNIRDSESSIQAIQPLADMLDTTSECEQQAALSALVKLTSDCNSRAAMLAEVEGNPLHSICEILSSASTWEMKSDAAELCCVLFDNPRVRELPIVSECIEPLILLMQSDKETAVESGVCAFERLLDDEKQVEIPSDHDVVGMLVWSGFWIKS